MFSNAAPFNKRADRRQLLMSLASAWPISTNINKKGKKAAKINSDKKQPTCDSCFYRNKLYQPKTSKEAIDLANGEPLQSAIDINTTSPKNIKMHICTRKKGCVNPSKRR